MSLPNIQYSFPKRSTPLVARPITLVRSRSGPAHYDLNPDSDDTDAVLSTQPNLPQTIIPSRNPDVGRLKAVVQNKEVRDQTGLKRGADDVNYTPSKKLRMLAEEIDKSSQETTLLKIKYSILKGQCADKTAKIRALELDLVTYLTDVGILQTHLGDLESERSKIETKLADLRRTSKNKDAQIRRDRAKITTLQEENREMAEKLRRAEKGWLAFKGLEDVFESKM